MTYSVLKVPLNTNQPTNHHMTRFSNFLLRISHCIKGKLKMWFIYLVRHLFISWIKFPDFYHSADHISPHRHKKLGAAPLIVIIGGATYETW